MKKKVLFAVVTSLFLAACGGGDKDQAAAPAPSPEPIDQAAGPSKVLNIYNWSDYVDPQTVTDFERAHKVKIRYDYYDSNETLEGKVLTGKSGYDLVGPSNGFVGRQIQAGAYQKIDKSKIPNYELISPALLEKMAMTDPGNEYVVPFFWGINTLAINVDKVKEALGTDKLPDNEWDLVFNPEYAQKLKSCGISLLDSPFEMYPVAMNYVGVDPQSSEKEDLDQATEMLRKVRPFIKRFSSSGYIDDMARGDLCVAVGYGGDLNIAKRRAEETNNGVKLSVLVPKTGFGVWIDSFAIPVDAQNLDNAYAYINNALEPKVAAKNGDFVTYAPSSTPAKALMDKQFSQDRSIFPSDDDMKNGFVMLPKEPKMVRYSVKQWQGLKSGQK
ncbi:polyamine ABC transporter substrate-binding protein [Neisseriaceae bacterium CLB008]|nr:polyamine ABC transporter substrate-binding protein [Neisseriaceae bacterium]